MHKAAKFCTARRCLSSPLPARPFCSSHWAMIDVGTRDMILRHERAGRGDELTALLRAVREKLERRDLERGRLERSQGAAAHV